MSNTAKQKNLTMMLRKTDSEVKANKDNPLNINIILEGISWCYLCALALNEHNLPTTYQTLSDASVLRVITDILIDKQSTKIKKHLNLLKALIGSLVNQKRKSDERVLPPLDWCFLYSYCDPGYVELEPLLVGLSIQQRSYKLFCRILSTHRQSPLTLDVATIIANNLQVLQEDLSVYQMRFIIEALFEAASISDFDSNILKQLANLSPKNPDVLEVWAHKIPTLDRASTVQHRLFTSFANVPIPKHIYDANAMLAIWSLSRSVDQIDLRSLFQYLRTIDVGKRATAYLIIAHNFEGIPLNERIEVILQLISISRIDGHFSNDDYLYWRTFVALCISEPRSLEIPLALFATSDDEAWQQAQHRICDHFSGLQLLNEFHSQLYKISYFFTDILLTLKTTTDNGNSEIRNNVKELLRMTLAADTRNIVENLEETNLWDEIFCFNCKF